MNQEQLSGRISSVISRVMDSFGENKYIDKENTFRHPDEQDVLMVLDELRQLVFRGFFAHTRYKVFTAQNHTSMLLEDILYHLSRQIELVLPYDEERYGAAAPEDLTEAAMSKALDFLEALPRIRSLLETDLDAAFDGDPAAFTRAKRASLGARLRALEDFDNVCVSLAMDSFDGYCSFDSFELLEEITAEDCRRFVAEELAPERLALSIVAPKRGEAET